MAELVEGLVSDVYPTLLRSDRIPYLSRPRLIPTLHGPTLSSSSTTFLRADLPRHNFSLSSSLYPNTLNLLVVFSQPPVRLSSLFQIGIASRGSS